MFEYKALVVKVYDADTITAVIDLGFSVKIKHTLRLSNIDAPEIRGKEKAEGRISRDYLKGLILGKEILIKTVRDKKGKYGRYLVTIYIEEDGMPVNVNALLVEKGYAEYKDY